MLDHVVHIDAMSTGLIDVFRTALEASNLLEQQRQSNVTRQLAAWGGIIAVPSAIAGIYGMNFANLPATQTSWGYWAILRLMASIRGLPYWRFRRLGWLRPARTRRAPVIFVGAAPRFRASSGRAGSSFAERQWSARGCGRYAS